MLAILNSLNVHNLPIFPPILIKLVSKFMVHRALSDETYLSLGLLSPPIIKRLAITLIYCNRLHAWWSTKSRLATLLSFLIARRWAGLKAL